MSAKSRLSQLSQQLKDDHKAKKDPKPKADRPHKTTEANVPRGERANFLKVTITLPPETLAGLRELGMKRKANGEKDTDVSSLIREAVQTLLKK